MADDTIEMRFDDASLSRLERAAQAMEAAARTFGQSAGAGWRAGSVPGGVGGPGLSWPGQAGPTWPGATPGPGTGAPAPGQAPHGIGGWVTEALGLPSALAGAITKIAAFGLALEGVGRGLSGLARKLDILSDPFTTGHQKVTGATESIPVLGTVLRGLREFGEALQGLNTKLKLQAFEAEIESTKEPLRIEHESQRYGLGIRQAGRTGLARARAAQAAAGFAGTGIADPSSVFDPLVMGRFSRQLGYAEHRMTLEAERTGLGDELGALEAEGVRLQDVMGAATHNRDKAMFRRDIAQLQLGGQMPAIGPDPFSAFGQIAMRSVSGGAAKPQADLQRAHLDLVREEAQVGQVAKQTQENILQIQEKKSAIAQKDKEIAQAGIALEREKLGVLREQSDIIRGSSQSYFRAIGGRREMALAWLKQANEKGFQTLIPQQVDEIVGVLGQAGGRWAQRNYEQMASRDPKFQDALRQLNDPALQGADFNLGKNLEAQRDLEKTIWDMTLKTEAKATAAFADAFGTSIDRLVAAMQKVMDAKVAELDARLRMQAQGRNN